MATWRPSSACVRWLRMGTAGMAFAILGFIPGTGAVKSREERGEGDDRQGLSVRVEAGAVADAAWAAAGPAQQRVGAGGRGGKLGR